MGDDAVVSLNGVMYRVRSCTERHGVWVEAWLPKAKGGVSQFIADEFAAEGASPDEFRHMLDAMDQIDNGSHKEPDNWFFIPGDVVLAIAELLRTTPMNVEPEEDDDEEPPHAD